MTDDMTQQDPQLHAYQQPEPIEAAPPIRGSLITYGTQGSANRALANLDGGMGGGGRHSHSYDAYNDSEPVEYYDERGGGLFDDSYMQSSNRTNSVSAHQPPHQNGDIIEDLPMLKSTRIMDTAIIAGILSVTIEDHPAQRTIRFQNMLTTGAAQWGHMILHRRSTPMVGMVQLRGIPIAIPPFKNGVPSTTLLARIIVGHRQIRLHEGPTGKDDTIVWAMSVFPHRIGRTTTVWVLMVRMEVLVITL
jgi:hypothetical protein